MLLGVGAGVPSFRRELCGLCAGGIMSCTCRNTIYLLLLIVHLFPSNLLHPTVPRWNHNSPVKWHFVTMEMRALNLESYECTVPSSGLNVEEVKKKKWPWQWFTRFNLILNLLFFCWLFNLERKVHHGIISQGAKDSNASWGHGKWMATLVPLVSYGCKRFLKT